MDHDTLIKTINLIIAPVVMITACGIMLNGLMLRYNWLSDRSRSVYQERLGLLEFNATESQSNSDRLHHLNHLFPDVLKHHHQVHDVLILIYLAIVFFTLDMLFIVHCFGDREQQPLVKSTGYCYFLSWDWDLAGRHVAHCS